jgi:hypothetical protein
VRNENTGVNWLFHPGMKAYIQRYKDIRRKVARLAAVLCDIADISSTTST